MVEQNSQYGTKLIETTLFHQQFLYFVFPTKTRSKEPTPPGIILTIPALEAIKNIGINADNSIGIFKINVKAQITKNTASHSAIEVAIN